MLYKVKNKFTDELENVFIENNEYKGHCQYYTDKGILKFFIKDDNGEIHIFDERHFDLHFFSTKY